MQAIHDFLASVSDFVWGPVMLVLLIGTGVYLTIGLRFFTFSHIGKAFKMLFSSNKNSADKGEQSSFNALMTALAGTIGTGSIVGVATAIMAGGPGALFWMWCTALVGMATKFAEILLALEYREVTPKGHVVGGAMYFIRNALPKKWHFLGFLFAALAALASFGIGNGVQANAISGILEEALDIPTWVTALALFLLVGVVVLGGVKRIGIVASRIVPAMVVLYLGAALIILIVNISDFPAMITMVIHDAFSPAAATGGFTGATVMMAIRFGMARGVFANEAGLGSSPIAHATATNTPIKQATLGMLDVFITTMIVCTMTGFAILVTNQWCVAGAKGAAVTAKAFDTVLPGVGTIIVASSIALFAFTTILGWCVYGERSAIFLFGDKALTPFRVLYTIAVPVGAILHLDIVWLFADVMNGLMAVPNLIGVLLLSPVVFRVARKAVKDGTI